MVKSFGYLLVGLTWSSATYERADIVVIVVSSGEFCEDRVILAVFSKRMFVSSLVDDREAAYGRELLCMVPCPLLRAPSWQLL